MTPGIERQCPVLLWPRPLMNIVARPETFRPRPGDSNPQRALGGNLHARLFNLLVGRGFEVL
jgi:hypothetical protein